MTLLKPLMGMRRQAQIDNALASYNPRYKNLSLSHWTLTVNGSLDKAGLFGVSDDGSRSVTVRCGLVTLGWLAGLLEGEGSFLSGPPSKAHLPVITIQMTDLDTMNTLGALLGIKPCAIERPLRHRKVIYSCRLVGSRAVALMKQLRPLMGIRRQAQIDKALASYKLPKNHDKVYPTRTQLLEHGARSTSDLAKLYGVSRCYIDKVRGPNNKGYPTLDQLLSHGACSTNALAKCYGVSWYYINKVRGLCKQRLP
jgi:hypothetical protein